MKKKTVLSLILIMALIASAISVPVFAAVNDYFRLEGKVILPGTDKAPKGGLIVTLDYCTDKGTSDLKDDEITPILIKMNEGQHEAFFSVYMPYTAKDAKYSLSYSVPETSKYWNKGYYTLNGMQYYKKGQALFDEGSVIKNLVITPLRASTISGKVELPKYSKTQGAVEVKVSAKTSGTLAGSEDDFKAETQVKISGSAVSYSLKVPSTDTNAGYVVMYETDEEDYENQGWYSTSGMTIYSSKATKVDVSKGNRSNINLKLIDDDAYDKFELEGKVVLPGTDKAPEGGLTVTLVYTTDNGTKDTKDDIVTPINVKLGKGEHEKSFSLELPYTDDDAKFSLGYTVPSSSKYWDTGYYTASGMKYYKKDELRFDEGDEIDDLVITPIRASTISGEIDLPKDVSTKSPIKVDIKAKTAGTSSDAGDDFEVKTNVTLDGDEEAYSLKVPATASNAGYTVTYVTEAKGYVKQGWYSTKGTVTEASKASQVDVSKGNRTDIDLVLVKVNEDKPGTPGKINYDLNGDKQVDGKDMVLVARAMGAKHKYVKAYDLNKDGVINVTDLQLIKAEMGKQLSSKYCKKEWGNYYGEDWYKYFDLDWEEYFEKVWENHLKKEWEKYFDKEWEKYLEKNWGKDWNKNWNKNKDKNRK